MTETAFHTYCHHAIAAYAQEHIRSGQWSHTEAYAHAQREYAQLLPGGLTTPNHVLYTVHDARTHTPVGMLWFAIETHGGQAVVFVYDIQIDPAFRRQGYATATMTALEDEVRGRGLATIGLHVFGHNHEARTLYEKLGYVPTNITLSKTLAPRPEPA
jgi:ribosomal protein S18 acetylase RimI-like enzyme